MAEEMSYGEIYAIQGFMDLLECELATYEYLCEQKRRKVNDIRRHRTIITRTFVEMAGPMLRMRAATEKSGKVYHPRYQNVFRVKGLLDNTQRAPSSMVIEEYCNRKELPLEASSG